MRNIFKNYYFVYAEYTIHRTKYAKSFTVNQYKWEEPSLHTLESTLKEVIGDGVEHIYIKKFNRL